MGEVLFYKAVTESLTYVICPEGLKEDSEIMPVKACVISVVVAVLQHLHLPAFTAD